MSADRTTVELKLSSPQPRPSLGHWGTILPSRRGYGYAAAVLTSVKVLEELAKRGDADTLAKLLNVVRDSVFRGARAARRTDPNKPVVSLSNIVERVVQQRRWELQDWVDLLLMNDEEARLFDEFLQRGQEIFVPQAVIQSTGMEEVAGQVTEIVGRELYEVLKSLGRSPRERGDLPGSVWVGKLLEEARKAYKERAGRIMMGGLESPGVSLSSDWIQNTARLTEKEGGRTRYYPTSALVRILDPALLESVREVIPEMPVPGITVTRERVVSGEQFRIVAYPATRRISLGLDFPEIGDAVRLLGLVPPNDPRFHAVWGTSVNRKTGEMVFHLTIAPENINEWKNILGDEGARKTISDILRTAMGSVLGELEFISGVPTLTESQVRLGIVRALSDILPEQFSVFWGHWVEAVKQKLPDKGEQVVGELRQVLERYGIPWSTVEGRRVRADLRERKVDPESIRAAVGGILEDPSRFEQEWWEIMERLGVDVDTEQPQLVATLLPVTRGLRMVVKDIEGAAEDLLREAGVEDPKVVFEEMFGRQTIFPPYPQAEAQPEAGETFFPEAFWVEREDAHPLTKLAHMWAGVYDALSRVVQNRGRYYRPLRRRPSPSLRKRRISRLLIYGSLMLNLFH